jgi:hypothetical protein
MAEGNHEEHQYDQSVRRGSRPELALYIQALRPEVSLESLLLCTESELFATQPRDFRYKLL